MDTELPIIEGIVEKYDVTTGITSYEPVKSGSKINQEIGISFRDNYALSYAEYYKAKYEKIDGVDTIEQEGMQEIIEVDLGQGLLLSEEGEYHIRVYDTSMNVSEYIVIIDKTSPALQVSTSRIDKNHTLVMIDSDEEIAPLDGWVISEDGHRIQKVYENSMREDVTVSDIAGNSSTITVETEDMQVTIQVEQNNQPTMNQDLNTNGGDIKVNFQSNKVMELRYSVNGSDFTVYQPGDILNVEGHYVFQAVFEGQVMDSLEFNISSMTTGN